MAASLVAIAGGALVACDGSGDAAGPDGTSSSGGSNSSGGPGADGSALGVDGGGADGRAPDGGVAGDAGRPDSSKGGGDGAPLTGDPGGPIPADRRADWTFTGVPGGIPHRTTVCATLNPGANASAINSAIATCNEGVVQLAAGTYSSLGSSIKLKSNVTLRGAGADQTILTGTNVVEMPGSSGADLGTAITGGATKGSTTFTVASTSNLAVGKIIEISRADDTGLIPYFGSWSPSNGRSIVQVNVITAMSGNSVTLRNPLFFDFASASPQVKFYYPIGMSKAGLEDLKIDLQNQGGYAVRVEGCDSCWIKGVDGGNGGNYVFEIMSSVNLEIRDSYIHDGGTGPNHSGISMLADYRYGGNSSARIENNILNKTFPNVEINNDSSGLHIGYNYAPGSNGGGNDILTWNLDDNHAPFPVMNLYEGNVADMWGSDGYYGGSGYGTALRNYFTGVNPNFNAKGDAVQLKRLAYDYNVVGNVIGSAQQAATAYESGCGVPNIFELGYPNIGNCDTTAWDSYSTAGGYPDSKVTSTLLRWGNYDSFNHAARFEATELPSGVPVPPDQTIPKSYVYASAPAWFGSVSWPPVGPDVTGGDGDGSGHAYKIPAQLCWASRNLGSGGSFNAAACYP